MVILTVTTSAAFGFLLLLVLFRPLEMAFPAKKGQRFFRRGWWTDFVYFLLRHFLWNAAGLWTLALVSRPILVIVPAAFRAAVAAQPWWLQAVEVVILSDFFTYWGHRLQHTLPLLWRFHAIHHSSEHLDWLAAHREHPGDTLFMICVINLPALLLGFPLETLGVLLAFRGLWLIFIHSNVRLPIGPLRWIMGAPELHHWHHDIDPKAGNYANLSPLMDLIFGTYHYPGHEPERFGIDQPISQNWAKQMIHPFIPQRFTTEDTESTERKKVERGTIEGEQMEGPLLTSDGQGCAGDIERLPLAPVLGGEAG